MPIELSEFYPPSPVGVPPRLTRSTVRYRIQAALVVAGLFAFLAVYLALLLGCATVSLFAFGALLLCLDDARECGALVGSLLVALAVVIGTAAGLLALYLLKGLFKSPRSTSPYLEITEAEQPTLFAFVRRLCADTGAPVPARVFVSAEVNASVFYVCSLWGLFVPAPKNLHIGLGLVNALNLSEFKAVLAHEFGHFSQRSLRLGVYVTTANQIVRDLIYGRDWIDESLEALGPLLALIRGVLGLLFRVITFAHAGLSRQMEYQADLVAVSATGSDALVHGLLRSDFAQECLDVTLQDLAAAADHGLRTRDLFAHQSRTMEYLRLVRDEPARGMPPALPEGDGPGPAVFASAEEARPPMWATHPPHHEREMNCKRVYIRGAQDERSAWVLFENADALRERVTRRHDEALRRGTAAEPQPAEAVQRFIDAERAETLCAARYHGLYEEGLIAPGSIDELMRCLPSRYEEPGKLLAEHADLFGPALRQRLGAYRVRRDDHRRLSRYARGQELPRGGMFTFRGTSRRTAEAAGLVALLEAELMDDLGHFATLDRRIFLVYVGMARQLDHETARALEERYRFHLAVQEMIGALTYWERRLDEAFGAIAGRRDPDPAAVQALGHALAEAQRVLNAQIAAAGSLRLPALRHLRCGEPLSLFLDAKPFISGFIGTEQIVDGSWLNQLLRRQAEVLDKLRRVLFKSLGGLLAYQERVGEQWKARCPV